MKRSNCDTNDSNSSDDELLCYRNKQKLTFDVPAIDNAYSSFSESSGDDDDGDDLVLKITGNSDLEERIVEAPETPKESLNSLRRENKLNSDILSPSPPPPTTENGEMRKTRKDNRADKISSNTVSLLLQKHELDNTNPLDDVIFNEEASINLKIRIHGILQKYEVKKSDPLKQLIADIARKENVVPGYVTLNCDNVCIDPIQTANSLGLSIVDIIECVIHTEDVDKENMINIKIQTSNKSHIYNVSLDETVESVFKDFSEKLQADVTKSTFYMDGEKISDLKATFSQLGVLEDDVIDADLK